MLRGTPLQQTRNSSTQRACAAYHTTRHARRCRLAVQAVVTPEKPSTTAPSPSQQKNTAAPRGEPSGCFGAIIRLMDTHCSQEFSNSPRMSVCCCGATSSCCLGVEVHPCAEGATGGRRVHHHAELVHSACPPPLHPLYCTLCTHTQHIADGPDYTAPSRNLALELVRVTEAAALSAARW